MLVQCTSVVSIYVRMHVVYVRVYVSIYVCVHRKATYQVIMYLNIQMFLTNSYPQPESLLEGRK